MDVLSMLNSLCEFVNGVVHTPKFAHLEDVMKKADTPFRYCITEREVDEAINSIKDFKHSKITQANYQDENQREADKNVVTAMAEDIKNVTKEYLSVRNLLVK